MKKYPYLKLLPVVLAFSDLSFAQQPFTAKAYIDINNIKASAYLHGNLWYDLTQLTPECEFPKNSGKHINATSALWMSAKDGNTLHISAQTYGQNGYDYWPGPLDVSRALTYGISSEWAKIWKVNRTDIDDFKKLSTRTLSNIPTSILEWPGKNNPHVKGPNGQYFFVSGDMAPFVDANNDGKYNPLDGDYPDIKGDQALWWAFSDNGPTHTSTNGQPLKVEVHVMAYAFKKNTAIDNVVFYEYNIHNKSDKNYTDFRVGIWSDIDLGYPLDDYIGFDSSHRMGYAYSTANGDGTGQPYAYGANPPISGIAVMEAPGDAATLKPLGSFMYYNNDLSQEGNPTTDIHYDNYLRSIFRGGQHLRNDFKGYGQLSSGTGAGPNANYIFPGNPADTAQWSDCASGNPPADRRMILATDDYSFAAGTKTKFAFALVTTDMGSGHACGSTFKLNDLKTVADTALAYYRPLGTVINSIAGEQAKPTIYPNPATDKIYIETPDENSVDATICIYDGMGRLMLRQDATKNKNEIDIGSLPSGVYHAVYSNDAGNASSTFIKQ